MAYLKALYPNLCDAFSFFIVKRTGIFFILRNVLTLNFMLSQSESHQWTEGYANMERVSYNWDNGSTDLRLIDSFFILF